MGRKRTGSVTADGSGWRGSVPAQVGARKRTEARFDTEQEAWAWVRTQLDCLDRGLPVTRPRRALLVSNSRKLRGAGGKLLDQYARAWHHERYEELEQANAERSDEVLDDVIRHLLPAFGPLFEELPVEDGRRLVKDWVRAMSGREPLTPSSPFSKLDKGYERSTVSGLLWLLNEILSYARMFQPDLPHYTAGIKAMAKADGEKRRPKVIGIEEAGQVAARLHVIHQLVFWLLRLAGLRIGEAYGLVVGNLIVDDDGDGFLLIEAQGGRIFVERRPDGTRRATFRKKTTKTASGFRLVALPRQLTTLIEQIIAAYHTAPDGSVDLGARLVPVIRSEAGGPAGARTTIQRAAQALGVSTHEDDWIVPHDLRKAFATDLAWSPEIDRLLARRLMGHRAGGDVFDAVYTQDSRLKEHLNPAARLLEAEIDAVLDTLMVPTGIVPSYAKDADRLTIDHAHATLEAAGWLVLTPDGYLTTAETAELLGMAETSTRRLFGSVIPAIRHGKVWMVKEQDVVDYRDRLKGHHFLPELAERVGDDYHGVRNTMLRLGIQPEEDDRTRQLLLTDDDAARIVAEYERIAALNDRSVKVAVAQKLLRVQHSTLNLWAREGRLVYDAETDSSGHRFITRASIDAELERRGQVAEHIISVPEFKELTGLDEQSVRALVKAGKLRCVRTGKLGLDSVRDWVIGYRPDLLGSRLLVR